MSWKEALRAGTIREETWEARLLFGDRLNGASI